MNFKYFIAFLYLSFVGLIVALVFKSCAQKLELETVNYYAEEINYQSQIDARLRGNVHADSVLVYLENSQIKISRSSALIVDSTHLKFKRPDNSLADRSFVFYGNEKTSISRNEFYKGLYNLKISYFKGGVEYLIEKKLKL